MPTCDVAGEQAGPIEVGPVEVGPVEVGLMLAQTSGSQRGRAWPSF